MDLKSLVADLGHFLQVSRFQDYCPNGLQIEGRAEVKHIVSGVTASQALIDAAIAHEADAVLVHHGYFWRGESPEITGIKKKRIKSLLDHDISLLAYHLPLDAHPQVGNNVQLAQVLGWQIDHWLDEKNMLPVAILPQTMLLSQLSEHVASLLQRQPQVLAVEDKPVKRVAWCTGAAQQYIQQAVEAGVDVFVSGEVSEQTWHTVCETGVAYLAAGHHATERYGVQALGAWIAQNYAVEHSYIECDNPI